MMKSETAFVILIACAAGISTASHGDETRGLEIMSEVDERATGFQGLTAQVTMILRSGKGKERERQFDLSLLEVDGDGDKQKIVFRKPADVKATALLTHSHVLADDDQWLFLPAFKRVKRISAANHSGPFVGSEFAYEDLATQDADNYINRYVGDEPVDDVPCFVVERLPRFDNSGYRRQMVYVDEDELRYQKIEFYDRENRLLKTLRLESYELFEQRFWRPLSMTMSNHQTGKSTVMRWEDIRYRTGLAASGFTAHALKRIR